MKQFFLLLLMILMTLSFSRCSDDDSNYVPKRDRSLKLTLTGRVGTVVGDELTSYVKSLNVLVFILDRSGTYRLYEKLVLTEAQLKALENSTEDTPAGFTTKKSLTVDELPVGTYRIVGVGNMLEESGKAFEDAALEGVTIGNTMDNIIANITDGAQSPRLFYGITSPVVLGAALEEVPDLTLARKVSMFVLTLKDVPQVVTKIELETTNTYGSFNMTGEYLNNPVISVSDSNSFTFSTVQDSILMTSVSLPTIANNQSNFTLHFTLDNGQIITLGLPKYVLKENTITKLTAIINTEDSGGQWKMNLMFDLSVDVEWNVDQEPPIII
ncbi:FimB/Mfa2 family fimbrial subunit [uncultured Sanguibacteroides sp.]|uniref:FimB/Mfa2 family fimbrial subunit n=1 Tax=uncultured Sanguibacteroides sp. TaxID=1635151 RepID=UPI0025ED556B|nr:FimB/Mfa2 family fimbrial subunit [uncultured Sanguibacteroides sp.]